jgi:hypothetical protein
MTVKIARANVRPIRQNSQYSCTSTSLSMALEALGIPMAECNTERVNAVLGAQPLESGEVEAGSYRICGSNESFNINLISLHFRNILVVLREGRVIGTYTAPPGAEWRRELGEWFMDLPNCPGYLLSSRGGAA